MEKGAVLTMHLQSGAAADEGDIQAEDNVELPVEADDLDVQQLGALR